MNCSRLEPGYISMVVFCPSGRLVTMRIRGMEGIIGIAGMECRSGELDLGMLLTPCKVGGGLCKEAICPCFL